MKIKRFNESLKGNWKPTDKVLVITTEPMEVLIDDIRKTDKFQLYGREDKDDPNGPDDYKDERLFYGIEEWIYTSGNPSFSYKLYDGLGNIIEDEPLFDKVKKYNN